MKETILTYIKQLLPKKSDLPRLIIILIWAVACYVFFQNNFKYHFFYIEQHQLFLYTSEYINTYFDKPAWLACLTGDYLTQYYYYVFAGPLILTFVLLILGDLLRRGLERQLCKDYTKRFSHRLMRWVAIIVALVVITYQARLSLDHSYHLSSIIALCGGAAMWLLHDVVSKLLRKWWARVIVLVIIAIPTYWMFGRGLWLLLIIEALSINIIPALAVGVIAYFCISSAAPKYYLEKDKALQYPGKGEWVVYKDVKLMEDILMFDNEYYWGNYAKVVELFEKRTAEQKENPEVAITNEMKFFYCLSLSQMQNLPEKLLTMDKPYLGTFESINDKTPLYTIGIIDELYYLIGDMTYTERAALLANTFSPNGRNVRMIKRLAEANLVRGDYPAAMKYLRILKQTKVYHQWAVDHSPETMSSPVSIELAQKRQFLNTSDNMRIGDNCYVILTQLLDSNPDNLIALDYLLCSDMLSGQKDTFIMDYEKYHGERRHVFQQIYNSAKQ